MSKSAEVTLNDFIRVRESLIMKEKRDVSQRGKVCVSIFDWRSEDATEKNKRKKCPRFQLGIGTGS